jgi:ferredoxin/flavodoxin
LKINKVTTIYFSPTGTGKKTANEIAKGTSYEHSSIDLTPPDASNVSVKLDSYDLAIFTVPVYGGRVPVTALHRMMGIQGDNTPAVLIALYGNRAFEDALLELHNTIHENGFKTIAAGAFIGQHSFDSKETPIATGRPDAPDLKKAYQFGVEIAKKLNSLDELIEIQVPGNYPYRERGSRVPMSPETDESTCIHCGACARECPAGCIEVSDIVTTNKEHCISCTACVQVCPTSARHWEHEGILKASKWLSTEHGDRKEPEILL